MISSTIDHLNLNGKTLSFLATSGGSDYSRPQSYVERTVKENGYDVQVNQGMVINSPRQLDSWLTANDF